MSTKKVMTKKTGLTTILVAAIGATSGIVTHYVDKHHEQNQLDSLHAQDIKKANQQHLHSTHGFRTMIDTLQQQAKIHKEELDIARGALGAAQDANLQLIEELSRTKNILDFYKGGH